MAKAIGNEIIKSVSGRLGSIDRTIGRDGGQMLNLIKRGNYTILGKKPLMPQTKSPGRQARTTAYCECDTKYKTLSADGKNKLQAYQIAFGTREEKTLTPFMFFMKLCLHGELCDLKRWSGYPSEILPPCPQDILSYMTQIDQGNPDTNYITRGWHELDKTDGLNPLQILLDLQNEYASCTLHIYESYAYESGREIAVYSVSPFNAQTVTWNTQPSIISQVGSFIEGTIGYNEILLTNPRRYILIKFAESANWGYCTFDSINALEGEHAPYATY